MSDFEDEMKKRMGYRGPEDRCNSCDHFVPADCSGQVGALGSHCALNPAVKLSVDPNGFCRYFVRPMRIHNANPVKSDQS